MNRSEWNDWWHHQALNVSFLQAFYAVSAYPRHSHDYYVIAVVDSGVQSFTTNGTKHITPPDGLILLNPGDVHTGEPVNEQGFVYRAFYPTPDHMQMIAAELGGRSTDTPFFAVPRADNPQMARWIRLLWTSLRGEESSLEGETTFLLTLAELMKLFGGQPLQARKPGSERGAVRKVCAYLHEHFAEPVTLADLAEHVHFSRYYLLHSFRDEMGMPPHQYLESVRVREAQKLLTHGQTIAQVAQQTGFASQSHLTRRFKQIIGVTPGAYARQLKPG